MKALFQSDLTKALLYFILTLAAAAALAPWLYNLGKMISEVAETRTTSPETRGIAGWCAQAEFAHFFLLSFLGCALVLAGPFICWLRLGAGTASPPASPWSLRIPNPSPAGTGQPLVRNPRRAFHWTTGFLLAGSLLALMNWLFLLTGWFAFDRPVDLFPAMLRAFAAAILLGFVLEWLFRGMLLGVLLRSLRPGLAITAVSLVYACLHFLLPGEQLQPADPGEADAGFRYVNSIALHASAFMGDTLGFFTLLFSGLILAYARYRTASLSLSIGLQAGWLFVLFLSRDIITFTDTGFAGARVIVSEGRYSGLVPLCILIATGLLAHVFAEISTRGNRPI